MTCKLRRARRVGRRGEGVIMIGRLVAVLVALVAMGCGGAAYESKPAHAGGTMPTSADVDRDAVMDSEDVAEPEEEALYRREAGPMPARGAESPALAQAPPPVAPAPTAGQPGAADKPKPDTAAAPEPPGPTVDTGTDQRVAAPLLIYTANVHLAVFEAKKAIDQAERLAKQMGGYLVRRDDRSITVRVPAGKFDGALAKMLELGDVLHRDVSVKDVTAEYFDLAVRLKNAEAVRDRLQKLLEKAANVSDAIQVERELARVTADIESMKGRLKLLRELVSFSTITLRFEARPVDHIDSKVWLPFPWLHQLGLSNLLRL